LQKVGCVLFASVVSQLASENALQFFGTKVREGEREIDESSTKQTNKQTNKLRLKDNVGDKIIINVQSMEKNNIM
jgi:hypothetical protein